MRQNLYIPSVDAKDLYLANTYTDGYVAYGYKLKKKDDEYNIKKFINSFDYSLDLIELRKIAKNIYKGNDSLSFWHNGKEYSSKIINVTYKYSVKEFNRVGASAYIKFGSNPDIYVTDLAENGYAFKKNELVAVDLSKYFYNSLPDDVVIPKQFSVEYDEEKCAYHFVLVKDNFKTIKSSKELREWSYENGFTCNSIKYCRFKRSSGSARVGKCLFIDNKLYADMHKAEQCGLDFTCRHSEDTDPQPLDIAAFEAYISLPTSSIIDTIEIKPENILVVDDYDSVFKDNAVCTGLDEEGNLYTEEKEMQICNCIWDGQSLIDISLMGDYKDKGMLLLRNKFFKSCCFNTNIQQFFKDNNITSVDQLNGFTTATDINDVKLITTNSSIKYVKFGEYTEWLKHIYPFFGVVKYDKNTHFFDGRLVQAHYQLLNTLQLSYDDVNEIASEGLNYINLLNTDVDMMRYHLKFNVDEISNSKMSNVMPSKNDMVYKLLCYDCGFERTKTYYDFKKDLLKAYRKNMKKGHVLINGTYATLLGNPYEMLQQSIGKFDPENISLQPGTVHNVRFGYGTDLLCCRSPHVTIGNILVTKNVECEVIDKYFNLTNNIICLNSIKENVLERLSGADFDSDSMIITDNEVMIRVAKKNYDIFRVPTRDVNPPKSKRMYTYSDLSDLDYKTSSNKIGDIINLSQELNSLLWDMVAEQGGSVADCYESIKEIYYDACQLDVMSNIEIDKAKKEFPVNNTVELAKIREKYSEILECPDGRKSMPSFLGFIAETKNYRDDTKKNYRHYNTAMDFLNQIINKTRSTKGSKDFLPLSEIFKPADFDNSKVKYEQIKTIKAIVKKKYDLLNHISMNSNHSYEEKMVLRDEVKTDLANEINRLKINEHTMYRILKQIDDEKCDSTSNLLFYVLFNYKNDTLTDMLNKYPKIQTYIADDDNGELIIYGIRTKKVAN